MLRKIKWNDLNDDQYDLSGDKIGWGINLSGNYRIGPHVLRGSVVYGEGIQFSAKYNFGQSFGGN